MNRENEADVNARYYGTLHQGQQDYWRLMAAPRARVKMAMSILGSSPPAELVDLGCGNGSLLSEASRQFPKARLVGIDLSSAQIEANRKENPLWPGMSWIWILRASVSPL